MTDPARFCAEKLPLPESSEFVRCPEAADPDSPYCRFHRPAYTTRSTR